MATETVNVSPHSSKEGDSRLRLLYLYQLLLQYSDENHTLSTRQIMELMEEKHSIHMHRTTVPKDIALLRSAGIEVMAERRQAWHYYLTDRTFSIPELKVLIDAVQSSRFITEKRSIELIEKLLALTSEKNASRLVRSVQVTGRAKTDNEKGYYIVDTVNDAINDGRKISFRYFDYDSKKNRVLKNSGDPYTVSPYDLIWDGDFYYFIGYCDERKALRNFRMDRISECPEILDEEAVPRPEGYDVRHYTQEVFRMYSSNEVQEITLLCDGDVMRAVVDEFGLQATTYAAEDGCSFYAKVRACPGPTFYRWIFGWGGKIKIAAPENLKIEYRQMLNDALAGIR